jgi:signal transduction histidine kinase
VRGVLDRSGDALLAVLSAALFTVQILGGSQFDEHRAGALAVALAFSATLALRRRLPLVPLVTGLGLIELSNLAIPGLGDTGTFFVGFVLVIYSAGRYTDGIASVVAAVLLVVAFPLAAKEPGQPFSVSDAAFIAVAFSGPFVAGRVIRRRQEQESELRVQTIALEHERDVQAREAVTQERARIARELHDVVAHAISVMVLQARGGRRKLPAGADETREALDAIEQAGGQALSDMRRLLEMLRDDDEEVALAPPPSLSRLDDLVTGLRAGGLPVSLTVEGDPRGLPPGVDATAFRIVQEALTNALKHAGPARAQVTLRYSSAALELEVLDDGRGGSSNGTSGTQSPSGSGTSGHGLVGIRERVALYGGEMESGKRPEGGYALRARLPLEPTR